MIYSINFKDNLIKYRCIINNVQTSRIFLHIAVFNLQKIKSHWKKIKLKIGVVFFNKNFSKTAVTLNIDLTLDSPK